MGITESRLGDHRREEEVQPGWYVLHRGGGPCKGTVRRWECQGGCWSTNSGRDHCTLNEESVTTRSVGGSPGPRLSTGSVSDPTPLFPTHRSRRGRTLFWVGTWTESGEMGRREEGLTSTDGVRTIHLPPCFVLGVGGRMYGGPSLLVMEGSPLRKVEVSYLQTFQTVF